MFTEFVAIDWSGAKGAAHPSIAVALCTPGHSPPILVEPPGRFWSRRGVLDWLLARGDRRPLVGFDFSFSAPHCDLQSYFRYADVAQEAKALWAYVDHLSLDNIDLGASGFVERSAHRREFYLGKIDGVKASYMRLRACELRFNEQGGGKPSSIFDAVGAAQVCKASFAGMRLLHRAQASFPVWPFDPRSEHDGLMVEIYTRAFLRLAGLSGRKVRDRGNLNAALHTFGSYPIHVALPKEAKASARTVGKDTSPHEEVLSDHATDALVAAAGLRWAANREEFWSPAGLTEELARTEGWTLGVV